MKKKKKENKNIAEAYFGKHWWLLVIPLIIYTFIAFREIGLPGLYMDSVNPDYMAAWLLRGNHHIPVWIFPDNYFAGTERYPLLNSLYGGNITAYLGLIFFKITGFGLVEVRVFHALLGMLMLVSLSWCLHKWKFPHFASSFALCLLAIDPTFLFAWRSQYYLQLVPVIFMSIGLGLLGEHYQRIKLGFNGYHHLFFGGIFLGFSAYIQMRLNHRIYLLNQTDGCHVSKLQVTIGALLSWVKLVGLKTLLRRNVYPTLILLVCTGLHAPANTSALTISFSQTPPT